MIFLQLFYTFLKIGIFTFGGGYAMVALIQNEVVTKWHWMTAQEFTDILAVSQSTPGPIGINTATYAGYTAVANEGFPTWMAVLGAFEASFAVVLLPIVLMLVVYRFLLKYKDNPKVNGVLKVIRLVVVGLITSAALILLTPENFGSETRQVMLSVAICLGVFGVSFLPKKRWKPGPISLILIAGLLGLLLY